MALGIVTRSSRRGLPGRSTVIDGDSYTPAMPTKGKKFYVDAAKGAGANAESWDTAVPTINAALVFVESGRGDIIFVAPGDYDEAVSVVKSDVMIYGTGNRGAVAVAPSATDGIAITVEGTAAARTSNVTFYNIGGEGNGTGGGLHVKGNIRRFRAYGCKFEGGAFGAKLESTAAGSVGDTIMRDCEYAWTTTALHLLASGGGDPVTQTYIYDSLFHNYTADGVLSTVAFAADLWLVGNVFANQEDATEPTQYLDIAVASTTGFVADNVFATTVFSTAKFAIAAGIIFANNISQAENPSAAVGGASGRPDA